ncbi:MMPL family transporter [Mycobacteroides abscessus]|uniref:MMPL family transporter n=1 Tax=Mycobacteroides abscessus TaxID=36809 RepID=UPI002107DBBB|nr:MMPL family transporter [Mycobacteroides abscessus]
MFDRIATQAIASPKRILLVVAFLVVGCGLVGSATMSHLLAGGQLNPNSESARANDLLSRHFGQQEMDLTLLVHSDKGVNDPNAAEAARQLVDQVRTSAGVTSVLSPWTATPSVAKSLTTQDGKDALVVAAMSGGEEQAPKHAKAIAERVSGTRAGLTVSAGGMAMVQSQIADQSQRDLLTMEAIAVPLSFLGLLGVFGGLYAALLPLLVGGIAIAGTLASLRLLTSVTDVSVYSMNVTTALALALGIDYTLLLLSRYREEVRQTGDRHEALRVALARAGRTVLFSSVTVVVALSTLTIFPLYFLRSMAYAGISVVVIAAISTIVVAPALIALLGDRIDALNFITPLHRWRRTREPTGTDAPRNIWYRSAKYAMRQPVFALIGGAAVLLTLASPILNIRFGMPTEQILPPSATARQVGEAVQSRFPINPVNVTSIVLSDARPIDDAELANYVNALSKVSGVQNVNAPDGAHHNGKLVGPPTYGTGKENGIVWLTVIRSPKINAFSTAADDQRQALRAVPAPGAATAQFTGHEQLSADANSAVLHKLPLVGTLIAVTTLILLFLLIGSVILPVKSLVLNLLALGAALGSVVWIFQDGHLAAFGTSATGTLVLNMLVFVAVLTFGLSMDYEVFIVARIHEHWLASTQTLADNEESVALGIATSGRVVSLAAMLMCIVFAAMCSAQVAFVRMFAVCLVIAVAADALLVRMLLVPAFMRLARHWNWWAPRPLAALHKHIGLSEETHVPRNLVKRGDR